MKNVLLAGAVAAALALTALSRQRASAQCCPQQCMRGGEISFNAGVTFGLHWTPSHGHWEPNCYSPYGYPPPVAPPCPPAAKPPAARAEQIGAPAPAKEAQPAVQSIGYSYPAPYNYGYGYGYYYGYPYYQGADYGYGR